MLELLGSATCMPSTTKAYGYISGFTGPKVTSHIPLSFFFIWSGVLAIWVLTLTSLAFGALNLRVTMLSLLTSFDTKTGAPKPPCALTVVVLMVAANNSAATRFDDPCKYLLGDINFIIIGLINIIG